MAETTPEDQYDILIAGAGLVGASLACALAGNAGKKHRIGVIEAGGLPESFEGTAFDPRVVALSNRSQRYLAGFGAWDAIAAARLCPYTDMRVWDAEGTGSIHFNSREVHQPCLGHIVENSVALRAILQCLQRCENVDLIMPAKVTGLEYCTTKNRVQVEIDQQRELSASVLIAADGANSQVRGLAGFRTREWDYGHKAIVTTVRTEAAHQFTAWQRFLSTGPLAFLPLLTTDGDRHYCSIVWSVENDRADTLMAATEEEFRRSLAVAFEHRLGAVVSVAKRFCIPLRQRHAVEYVHPGIALVGDAAHTIHPLAGQGVNLGFLDAEAIAAEIQRAAARGIPLADFSILRRYQRQRMADNLGMMGVMEGFKRLFAADQLPLRWLRNTGMRWLDDMPVAKQLIVRQAMGL